jgi:putative nucleotide binding protein
MEKRYERHAYVLDLLRGRVGNRPYRAEALIQVVGEDYFTLLEAVVRENTILKPHDRVYVGKDAREEVAYIIGRIGYDDLTTTAKMELATAVEMIVLHSERKFIKFFNTAQAITPRMHSLELIPGIGKKYMWQILDEREKSAFKSFEELQQRINIPKPSKLIAKRIIEELAGESKYRLFTRPA